MRAKDRVMYCVLELAKVVANAPAKIGETIVENPSIWEQTLLLREP